MQNPRRITSNIQFLNEPKEFERPSNEIEPESET